MGRWENGGPEVRSLSKVIQLFSRVKTRNWRPAQGTFRHIPTTSPWLTVEICVLFAWFCFTVVLPCSQTRPLSSGSNQADLSTHWGQQGLLSQALRIRLDWRQHVWRPSWPGTSTPSWQSSPSLIACFVSQLPDICQTHVLTHWCQRQLHSGISNWLWWAPASNWGL